jgi:hypothetical protein
MNSMNGRNRRRRTQAVVIAVAASTAVAFGAMVTPSGAWRGHRSAFALNVLHANNIARIGFGDPAAAVIRRLDFLLGHPPKERYHLIAACNVDRVIAWPGLAVFFRRGRFVGYSYRPAYGRHRGPTLATARGLRVGNTLAKAKRLYGPAFHASRRGGGSWWVSTPSGRLGGLASGWPGGPKGSVATISAGRVGCPLTAP